MGRPKGSRDKQQRKQRSDKANGKPPAEATPGHNSGELSDDQKQALWFKRRGRIVSLRAKIASLTGELRNEYKGLKAELGVSKAEADFAIRLVDDDDTMLESEKRRRMLARWEGHPIGTQSDLFETDLTPLVDKAKAIGKIAGMKGEPRRSPYQGEAEQAWMDGYNEGQTILAQQGFKQQRAEDAKAFDDAAADAPVN